MLHPLVIQLRFTRSEWLRALNGITAEEALRRLMPMNSIGWIVGHLAWQEQRYWLTYSQGQTPFPELNELVGNGRPATTPALSSMMTTWHAVTQQAEPLLNTIDTDKLASNITLGSWQTTVGSLLLRVNYHYWYHIGEIMAIRQLLGHTGLPDFVGDIDNQAPYQPE